MEDEFIKVSLSELREWIHDANNHLSVIVMTLSQIAKTDDFERLLSSRDTLSKHSEKILALHKELISKVSCD
jgi:hypothetical protein